MAFNASGTFVRLFDWSTDRDNGVKILADRMDSEMDGMATGLTTTICKDGQSTTSARIPFNLGISISSGLVSAPGLTFTGDGDTGIWSSAANTVSISCGGTKIGELTSAGLDVTGRAVMTSNSATSLVVGPNGTTNPSLLVDSSTASGVTGLKISNAASGGSVTLTATSSGADESFIHIAKGTGTHHFKNGYNGSDFVVGTGAIGGGGFKYSGLTTNALTFGGGFGNYPHILTGIDSPLDNGWIYGIPTGGYHSFEVNTIPSLVLTSTTATTGPNAHPTIQADFSAGSSATGIKVTAAAAAGGVALAVTSSGSNESATIDAKGSGTLTINGTATGAVTTRGLVTHSGTIGGTIYSGISSNASAFGGSFANYPYIFTGIGGSPTDNGWSFGAPTGYTHSFSISGNTRLTISNTAVAATVLLSATKLLGGAASIWSSGIIESTFDGATAFGIAIKDTSVGATAHAAAVFNRGVTQTGSITVTDVATAFNTSSDADLKYDERPYLAAGEVVDRLKVWDHAWKANGKRSIGVYAQEAFEVFPDAITPSEKQGGWMADYSKFVPVLIAALQQANRRIAALEFALAPSKPSA